ncbi:hypothetical protein RIF29_41724 [Crotalaria pallida]|uniref:Uncharacterized protein n=1 Tax=Crotalaria pallida TaxID=3830 RepID=A0AAN9HRT8_CROPI
MESLLSQFTFLSDQALQDKNFDPSTIEDLMKLFEIESYKAWAAAELEQEKEVEEAEVEMQQAEDYLDSVMESAMDEFRAFELEFEMMSKAEMKSLVETAESARKMGKLMEKAASVASKTYIEAAMNSATASMKSAWKGVKGLSPHGKIQRFKHQPFLVPSIAVFRDSPFSGKFYYFPNCPEF